VPAQELLRLQLPSFAIFKGVFMKLLVLAALVLASSAAQAFIITTTPMAIPISTSEATSGSDSKLIILQAKDDAAAFIASDGQIQGAFLEAAIQKIRLDHPDMTASDRELAHAILATEN
jgi:uncharacterized protein (TIGR02448 family)